jgi:hypothetical protein
VSISVILVNVMLSKMSAILKLFTGVYVWIAYLLFVSVLALCLSCSMQYLVVELDICCIIDSDFLLEGPNSLPVFEVPDVLRLVTRTDVKAVSSLTMIFHYSITPRAVDTYIYIYTYIYLLILMAYSVWRVVVVFFLTF